jgi:hypothetical protein
MKLSFQFFASWRRSAVRRGGQVGKFAGGFFLAELAVLAELAELVGVAWKS